MINRFVILTGNGTLAVGTSWETTEEAARKNDQGDDSWCVAELVPVKEIEELRELATSKKNLTALCVEKDGHIKELTRRVDHLLVLRMADDEKIARIDSTVYPPMPGPTHAKQLHEQRLWEAFVVLVGADRALEPKWRQPYDNLLHHAERAADEFNSHTHSASVLTPEE